MAEIAALQRKLDNLRKSKNRSKKAKTAAAPQPPKATGAVSGSSKPKPAKNGHASGSKPRKSGGANGAPNGKARRESAAYDDDDDDDEEQADVGDVTLEQKQELAEKIQLAGEVVLNQAITIIQETTSLGDVSGAQAA